MKRTLTIAVALIVLLAIAAAAFFVLRRPALVTSTQGVTGGEDQLARGEYLARAGDCVACHTVRGGTPYAGGLPMATPFGTMYTTNITPDNETGIGTYTDDDFWRVLHEGRSKNGAILYPAMPYTNYAKVTRADSDAIYAYLMSLQPVRQPNIPHEMAFPFNQRDLLIGWRTLYFKPAVYQDDPKQTKEWNRGAYLVEGLGHCDACHATRNILGAVSGSDIAGGLIPVQNWYAPSLTSNRETGLGDWEISEVVDLLKTGVSARGAVFGPMSAVVHDSLQYMTEADLKAMTVYLKSKRQQGEPAAPAQIRPTEEQTEAMMTAGAKIYEKHCAECHQPKGEGVPRIYPPLANNEAITMGSPVNAIRVTLNGGFPPSTQGNPRPYGMPPFAQELSDQEVAAVVTYIRQAWGNRAPPVSHIEVANARGVPTD